VAAGYAIVLATYNGAEWLEAQLESIRAQTAGDWRLYARDDGSTDATLERLREAASRDPRIEVIGTDARNLGAAASFGVLLQHALDRSERYVFLADQDDVWLPDKCARMLAIMSGQEFKGGATKPLLVHSDLAVVAGNLSPIHASFAAQQGFDAGGADRAARLLLANHVTGCATLVNAALLRCALPMPRVAMHDWWLAQCAAAFGEVHFLDVAMVQYRQHGGNVVGARGQPERAATIAASPANWWRESAARFLDGLRQLWEIRARARAQRILMVEGTRRALEILWNGLGKEVGTPFSRMAAARASGALPASFARRVLVLARVAFLPSMRAKLGDERAGAPETSA
jgi:hypothetical protein